MSRPHGDCPAGTPVPDEFATSRRCHGQPPGSGGFAFEAVRATLARQSRSPLSQNAGLSKTGSTCTKNVPVCPEMRGCRRRGAPDFSTTPHFGTRFFDNPAIWNRQEGFAFDNPAFWARRPAKTCTGALHFDNPAFWARRAAPWASAEAPTFPASVGGARSAGRVSGSPQMIADRLALSAISKPAFRPPVWGLLTVPAAPAISKPAFRPPMWGLPTESKLSSNCDELSIAAKAVMDSAQNKKTSGWNDQTFSYYRALVGQLQVFNCIP
jgi:hypothetical protein